MVGARLQAMGHKVKSVNGEDMGGFQAIWFHPYGAGEAASKPSSTDQPIAGVYRSASDHRKDGEAVGW